MYRKLFIRREIRFELAQLNTKQVSGQRWVGKMPYFNKSKRTVIFSNNYNYAKSFTNELFVSRLVKYLVVVVVTSVVKEMCQKFLIQMVYRQVGSQSTVPNNIWFFGCEFGNRGEHSYAWTTRQRRPQVDKYAPTN